jgi:hypothetical protein
MRSRDKEGESSREENQLAQLNLQWHRQGKQAETD